MSKDNWHKLIGKSWAIATIPLAALALNAVTTNQVVHADVQTNVAVSNDSKQSGDTT